MPYRRCRFLEEEARERWCRLPMQSSRTAGRAKYPEQQTSLWMQQERVASVGSFRARFAGDRAELVMDDQTASLRPPPGSLVFSYERRSLRQGLIYNALSSTSPVRMRTALLIG